MPTHAMMTKAPSTSAGYRLTSTSSWPITSRIAMTPRMPPVMITQSLFDIATATRIESIAKTMSVSSTFATVDQNGDRPSHDLRRLRRPGGRRRPRAP